VTSNANSSTSKPYYNAARSHAALSGNTPLSTAVGVEVVPAELDSLRWVSHCRGLVQLPTAA
jgi:hypothetical protein